MEHLPDIDTMVFEELKLDPAYEELGVKFSLNRFVGTAKNAVAVTEVWTKRQYGFEIFIINNSDMTNAVLQKLLEVPFQPLP